MNKKLILGVIAVMLLSVGTVFAAKPTPAADNGLNHPGQASQLYLYQKDPSDWTIVDGGAWGKMTFSTDSFVFNGHGLTSGTDYSLIYYPDFDNRYTLNFLCISGCSGTHTHTMIIDAFDENGFTGHGYYNTNPAYTWTVTGTSKDTFTIVYTGLNPGYTVICIDGACTGPGQTFNLDGIDTGSAVWPHPIEILGTGTANGGGNVNIAENFDFKSIPWVIDFNAPDAKIWLVKSGDLNGDTISGWNPTEYLFEYNLI